MIFENPQFIKKDEQKVIPKITQEDNKFLNMNVDNPELLNWMKEKNIEFYQGVIEVEDENGNILKMETSKNDFGTFEYPDKKE